MIHKERAMVVDIDGTLCPTKEADQNYRDLVPFPEMVARLWEYKKQGFYIILCTSRNMRTYEGNIGKILANTAKVLFEWLDRHQIPYDEIHFGKPWPGKGGFYVDDKAIRPSEFMNLSYEQVEELLSHEKGSLTP